jgi:protein gp37
MTTGIQWTDETWNPIVGCDKISEGCRNCYAIGQAYRNAAMGAKLANPGRLKYYQGLTEKRGDRTEWTGVVNFVPEALELPLKWKKPRRVFVNSMGDLFHVNVKDHELDQIFAVMGLTPQHTYQVLTKRPGSMMAYLLLEETRKNIFKQSCGIAGDYPKLKSIPHYFPLPNVWLGVTIENQKAADERLSLLKSAPAAVRFLSCEPLLEPVDLGSLAGIDWVIVGGESGHGARDCDLEGIRSIVQQCKDAAVPVFVKQLGSKPVQWQTSDKKGAIVSEFPEDLQIQEFPKR